MGVTPPQMMRIPRFTQDAFEMGPHPLFLKISLEVMDFKNLAKLRFCRMPDNDNWNLTQEMRRALWQAEWDKRTLLRPAQGVGNSAQLLRAAE
jgi:hypothetical protein